VPKISKWSASYKKEANITFIIDINQQKTEYLSIRIIVNISQSVKLLTEENITLKLETYLKIIIMKNLIKVFTMCAAAAFVLSSCEGPMGPAGKDGVDANESCKLCHATTVDSVAVQFEHSMHAMGEAYEEGTRSTCAPCHSHQGFSYVVKNNTPVTFTIPAGGTKYANNYDITAANAVLPGPISCFTCHSSLHKTFTDEDWTPLTTTAAVPMTMYGGSKTINFAKASGNLCAKCHQPRPVATSATSSTGNIIDYAVLVSAPTATFTQVTPSYRTGVHYGTQSAMAAGVGAIEFGTGYTQSAHVAGASCNSCHMANPNGFGGGHSFSVVTSAEGATTPTYNFNGCNVAGCHTTMSATNTTFTGAVNDIKTLTTQLATKINAIGAGHDILQKDPVDNQYHGYFDIYDASANPTGYWKNPANGTPAFPTLTNAQFGAIINFQMVVRGGGLGVHNYPYIKKLLENTLAAW
jgi:hypothetical protein